MFKPFAPISTLLKHFESNLNLCWMSLKACKCCFKKQILHISFVIKNVECSSSRVPPSFNIVVSQWRVHTCIHSNNHGYSLRLNTRPFLKLCYMYIKCCWCVENVCPQSTSLNTIEWWILKQMLKPFAGFTFRITLMFVLTDECKPFHKVNKWNSFQLIAATI